MIYLKLFLLLILCAGAFILVSETDDAREMYEELGNKRAALIFKFINILLLALGIVLMFLAATVGIACLVKIFCYFFPQLAGEEAVRVAKSLR